MVRYILRSGDSKSLEHEAKIILNPENWTAQTGKKLFSGEPGGSKQVRTCYLETSNKAETSRVKDELIQALHNFTESLILAQDERWRRA